MHEASALVPGGILEPLSGHAFLFFGTNNKTSDFIADGLLSWRLAAQAGSMACAQHLVINLDNGPKCNGRRSQSSLIP